MIDIIFIPIFIYSILRRLNFEVDFERRLKFQQNSPWFFVNQILINYQIVLFSSWLFHIEMYNHCLLDRGTSDNYSLVQLPLIPEEIVHFYKVLWLFFLVFAYYCLLQIFLPSPKVTNLTYLSLYIEPKTINTSFKWHVVCVCVCEWVYLSSSIKMRTCMCV